MEIKTHFNGPYVEITFFADCVSLSSGLMDKDERRDMAKKLRAAADEIDPDDES